METQIIPVDTDTPEPQLKAVCDVLREGGVIAFPTETVYGLGGDALNPDAVTKIYAVKGRPADNPLIVHIHSRLQLTRLVETVPVVAEKLIERFWPGPLTLLFKKQKIVPDVTTAGLDTVAVRMPSHPVALRLLRQSDVLIAAPSANSSGKPSPTTAQHVYADLSSKIPFIIDGGRCDVGLESTILDVSGASPVLLRPGGVTREQIEETIGPITLDPSLEAKEMGSLKPKAPGMKYKHYSPHATVELVEEQHSSEEKILSLCQGYQREGLRVMVIAKKRYGVSVTDYTMYPDETELAHDLFFYFRKADDEKMDRILITDVSEKGMGYSVLNRIKKAAKHIY